MARPELKQFGDLTPEDFARHPVWIGCHTADYDEPWYDETDEETFRPRSGDLPADPSEGMLLVRATAVLADGSRLPAFLTPDFEKGDLGIMQPQVFIEGRMFSFWGGGVGIPEAGRRDFYRAAARPAEAVFPIRFVADEGLSGGVTEAEVHGFYRMSGKKIDIER